MRRGRQARRDLRAYDSKALVTCDPATEPLTKLARERPIYALMMFPESLKQQTGLNPVAVGTIRVPYGKRYPEFNRPLYRLELDDATP